MNKVILLGFLVADPETKEFPDKNLKLTKINLAVNDMRSYTTTYFFNCVAWNQTAEYMASNLKKGDFVCVDGKLTNRSYVNNEGKKNTIVEIVIENIRNLGSRKSKAVEQTKENNNDVNETFSKVTNNEVNSTFSKVSNIESDNQDDKEFLDENSVNWDEELK